MNPREPNRENLLNLLNLMILSITKKVMCHYTHTHTRINEQVDRQIPSSLHCLKQYFEPPLIIIIHRHYCVDKFHERPELEIRLLFM